MVRDDKTLAPPPPPASPRAFGVVMAVICGLIGTYPLIYNGPPRLWVIALGVGLLAIGWVRPAWLAPATAMWLRFGAALHKVTSLIILGTLFFTVLTPLAMLSRASGGDRLRLKRRPAGTSYWLDCDPAGHRPDFEKPY
ncbi:SxtJ family membrane protein [Zavarzinia sp. CC-PAN008]|uniref:SxtJ family membrane protein n=1 Tax=Zavarzinia sp. CC-PAN008 TaxID=3243332 RepID=UPI003F747392